MTRACIKDKNYKIKKRKEKKKKLKLKTYCLYFHLKESMAVVRRKILLWHTERLNNTIDSKERWYITPFIGSLNSWLVKRTFFTRKIAYSNVWDIKQNVNLFRGPSMQTESLLYHNNQIGYAILRNWKSKKSGNWTLKNLMWRRRKGTRVRSENTSCKSQKWLPLTMIFEMSSRLTHEHLDFPSSATKRNGPCPYPLIRPFSFLITKQKIDYIKQL